MIFRRRLILLLMMIVPSAMLAQPSSFSLKWTDAKMGLKIKALGYGWEHLDKYLAQNNFQTLGERPLLAFGFPLEFRFIVRDHKLPIGFAFEFASGGSFSRAYGQNDFTRLTASTFNAGIYWQQDFGKRFFVRPYVGYGTTGAKLSAFLVNQNQSLPFAGGEYRSRISSALLQLQLGAAFGNRFQFGLETFYNVIVDHSDWTLISTNQKTEIPTFTSNGKNLGISVFFYFKIY